MDIIKTLQAELTNEEILMLKRAVVKQIRRYITDGCRIRTTKLYDGNGTITGQREVRIDLPQRELKELAKILIQLEPKGCER